MLSLHTIFEEPGTSCGSSNWRSPIDHAARRDTQPTIRPAAAIPATPPTLADEASPALLPDGCTRAPRGFDITTTSSWCPTVRATVPCQASWRSGSRRRPSPSFPASSRSAGRRTDRQGGLSTTSTNSGTTKSGRTSGRSRRAQSPPSTTGYARRRVCDPRTASARLRHATCSGSATLRPWRRPR